MKRISFLVGVFVLIPGLLAILVGGLVHAIDQRGALSSDAASWVQAIGATVGIGIAIYVPWRQKVDAAASAESERIDRAMRVSLAFRDELTLAAGHFNGANVVEILRDAPTEYFGGTVPVSHDRYPIYRAMAHRLIEINDEATRRSIIAAYEGLNSVIAMATLNNRLVEEHDLLMRKYYAERLETLGPEIDSRRQALISFRSQTRGIVMSAIKDVHKAILLLDRAIKGTHDDFSPPNIDG